MTYSIGDPNHLGVHQELVDQVQTAASEMGVDVDLPPIRSLGELGHTDDHNLIQAALDKIAAEGSAGASWAQVISAPDAVTGSYYDDKGGQWAFYEWNAAGTFDVELSGGLLWVLCVGGGGQGESANEFVNQGQPGLVREGLWEFSPGIHPVTVGKANPSDLATKRGAPSFIDDVLTGFSTQGSSSWGHTNPGRGVGDDGYKSDITGDLLEYATGVDGAAVPGRSGWWSQPNQRDGCVIIATRIDVPTLPPAPPRLEVAPVVAKPVSISGPAVQEWLVRDKQNNRKVVYFLPGNTGTARSLGLTEDGAAALEARRDLLDAIATTDVPEDFEGDPVTLLPKKLRGELTGFVEVRATAQPEAVYSVTLGAGVLPGVMVGAGGSGGYSTYDTHIGGGGGAGGVIGQGAHVPIILPVQGTATYTVTVASTCPVPKEAGKQQGRNASATTLAVQGQTPFACAVNGGGGFSMTGTADHFSATNGASGGGCRGGGGGVDVEGYGIPGQGHDGLDNTVQNNNSRLSFGGGGYGGRPSTVSGGPGFDLATALNLDANDGITGQFLALVTVDGWIAGGGASQIYNSTNGTATGGGGGYGGHAKDYTGGGGGGTRQNEGRTGGAGAVYIITDPT
jgi:hypothetical protein